MKQQHLVLPERCIKCGAVFDLWFDLLAKSEGPSFSEKEEFLEQKYSLDEFLCWRCRRDEAESKLNLVIEIEPLTEEAMELDEER